MAEPPKKPPEAPADSIPSLPRKNWNTDVTGPVIPERSKPFVQRTKPWLFSRSATPPPSDPVESTPPSPTDSETVLANKDLAGYGYRTVSKVEAVSSHSTDTTAYTFLDYCGLGLILMAIEAVGHRWIDDLPINHHTLVAAGTAMLAGAIVLGISKKIKSASKPKGLLFQDFVALTNKAWFWVVVAAAIIFGVPFTVSYVSPSTPVTLTSTPPPSSTSNVLCWDGPCPPTHLKPGPQYLKEIGIGSGHEKPLSFQGTSIVTTDRLRVFVDYSEYRSGWMPKTRAFIGELKEPVKGKIERLQLIYSATKENAGTNTLWWGDPSQNNAVTTPTYSSSIPAIIVRARIAVIGSNGEQHYYFMLVRGAENIGTYVGVIPEHDSGDWIESWEKE